MDAKINGNGNTLKKFNIFCFVEFSKHEFWEVHCRDVTFDVFKHIFMNCEHLNSTWHLGQVSQYTPVGYKG